MIADLKVNKTQTKQSQIAEFIREKILAGNLKENSRLPSTQALSKEWDMPEATVHRALALLVKEGLLTRKPKMGTIVTPRNNKLSSIAVYVQQDLLHPISDFMQLLVGFIDQELKKRHIECRIFIESNEGSSFHQVSEMAEKKLIQGVIVPMINPSLYSEIKKLPVPFSCITSAKIKNRVPHYDKSFMDMSAEAFKKMNCKKIALLSSIRDFDDPINSGEREQHEFHAYFREVFQSNGFEIRDEWIRTHEKEFLTNMEANHFAFDAFHKIWQCQDKPDGLLVYTEDLINGTLLAIMDEQIQIPNDLKLVMHHNKENTLLCPVPCFFVESNIHKMALNLIGLIVDQFSGKELTYRKQSYVLTQHHGRKK